MVHNPPRVIATNGSMQVGCVTSVERDVSVTPIACINTLRNSIPPVLIFPTVQFQNSHAEHCTSGHAWNLVKWFNKFRKVY